MEKLHADTTMEYKSKSREYQEANREVTERFNAAKNDEGRKELERESLEITLDAARSDRNASASELNKLHSGDMGEKQHAR